MKVGPYTLDLSPLEGAEAKRILVQLPEGLMGHADVITEEVERITGGEAAIYHDPTYGACDIPMWMLDSGYDIIVHIGHSPIPSLDQRHVVFVEAHIELPEMKGLEHLEEVLKGLGVSAVAITATVQYIDLTEPIKEWLEAREFTPLLNSGTARIAHRGQVLGCNFSAARGGEAVIFIGSGRFHPIGIHRASGRDVVCYNPATGEASLLKKEEVENFVRKRWAAISRAGKARSFGILVSVKPGQNREALARELRREAQEKGLTCDLIVGDRISPEIVDYYPYEAFVSTACPRIATDDYFRFRKPVLTPQEFRIALGIEEWTGEYIFDEM